nr:zinc finger, CCHC-type [Tanacetum cinerariifolium]
MPGNENKVCKLIKSLYRLKHAHKQWHQKFDEVVMSNGYLLNQADKCVYKKFDESGKGVIICLYVDDILIFRTDQVQVDLTKEFLSSRFSMKDMGEVDVILGIRIKYESNGIAISQSYYIENFLKKFNYSDCTPVSTPLDTYEKLMPNKGLVVSQFEYSRVIGYLMYAMTCTRPDIAFVVGKLSRYTSNLGSSLSEWYTSVIARKYPHRVNSSEDVSALNYQRAHKQWHQKFDEVVLSNGYLLNQGDKCVYKKFDESGKGVIICLYVDDILIFRTDQVQVDLTKEFLSSRFSMKDMEEVDVILGIRIKHESNGIAISQSYYIEKFLKKFNYSDCTPVSTPLDTYEKLMPNKGLAASKNQTCITSSAMESEFVSLAAAGKEAEWLKNLLFEISLWVKPMAPISLLCDSASTLAKAYSKMYNEKVADEVQGVHSLNGIHQRSLGMFTRGLMVSACIELSAGMLLSELADISSRRMENPLD